MSRPALGQPSNATLAQNTHKRSAPLEHQLYEERNLVIVKFGDRVSMREIEHYVNLLKADPKFRPDFSEIVNLTSVTEFDLGGDDFMKLADRVDPFASEARRAFVAVTSVQQHAARMHKILRVNRNFEIFSSMAAAEQWVES